MESTLEKLFKIDISDYPIASRIHSMLMFLDSHDILSEDFNLYFTQETIAIRGTCKKSGIKLEISFFDETILKIIVNGYYTLTPTKHLTPFWLLRIRKG